MNEGRAMTKAGRVLLLALALLISGVLYFGKTDVHAATPGFVTINGATYYLKANGEYHTGWLNLDGSMYYFYKGSAKMAVGWVQDSKGQYRYFSKTNGKMAVGWVKNSKGEYRYFSKSSGVMATGWITSGEKDKRYFNPDTGIMYTGLKQVGDKYYYFLPSNGCISTGWKKNSKGQYRYFYPSKDYMATGWVTDSKGRKRYFSKTSGIMYTGWVTTGTDQRYFDIENGIMAVGTVKIDGVTYTFNKTTGVLETSEKEDLVAGPTGTKTIKNLLKAAMQPVGCTLYVWAGGHNSDATLVGVNPAWVNSYQTGDYVNGLDCSGYVGWSIYQVLRVISTGWSGSMIDLYCDRGWGVQAPLSTVSTFKAGDVVAHSDHIWMILGQCPDGSVVVLHSAGTAGPQLGGTGGQAVELVREYMSRYQGYYKYHYDIWTDPWLSPYSNYYYYTDVFRWNRATLADPEGYTSMTAEQILMDLFS